MNNCFRIGLCILLLAAFSSFSLAPEQKNDGFPQEKGKVFQFTNGGFKVYFPKYPDISSEVVDTDLGDTEMVMFLTESPSGNEAHMVSYNDYRDDAILSVDPKTLLVGGRDGALNSLGIPYTLKEEWISLQGVEGLYFKGNNQDYFVEYYIYLKGKRLYQIAVLAEGNYSNTKDTKKFLKTFKFI